MATCLELTEGATCLELTEGAQSRRRNKSISPFNFEDLAEYACVELLGILPGRFKALNEKSKRGYPLYNVFKDLWEMKEAHPLLTPSMTASAKSAKRSFTYWNYGNNTLSNDKEGALKHYNTSILIAPHPPISIGDRVCSSEPGDVLEEDPGSHDPEGWGKFVSLARGYEARAALLFEMKQYNKCVSDIDRVLQLGCPTETSVKLKAMKKSCKESLRKFRWHRTATTVPPSFDFKAAPPPTLKEPNSSVPSMSNAVKLAYDGFQAEHFVAAREIQQGEIIAVEESYCSTILPKHIKTYCTTCMIRAPVPLPCPCCTMVVFCSEKCREEGLAGIHWQECPILATLTALDMDIRTTLSYRIILKATRAKLLEAYPQVAIENWSTLSPGERGLNDRGSYDSKNYLTVFNMPMNRRPARKTVMLMALEAFVLLKVLIKSGRFFVDGEGNPEKPDDQELHIFGWLLSHHMTNLWYNAQGFLELQVIDEDINKNPLKAYGAGVFPAMSLVRDSIHAQCVPFNHGRHLVLRAVRGIPAGQTVTCRYANLLFETMSINEDHLNMEYVFFCRESCCWEIPPTTNLKCVRCRGALPPFSWRCPKCNLTYNKVGKVRRCPNLRTYDYCAVKEKLGEHIKNYKHIEEKLKNGHYSEYEKDLEVISNVIKFFDSYVQLPAATHRSAQCLYTRISHHLSTSVQTKQEDASGCEVS